ncbi:MAG: alpha/beta hydrolase [Gemmatimonadetes bacterium]|nr:alpha/beta hydrolase [Gemmatimonadota bacterium]
MKVEAQELYFKAGSERLCFRAWEAATARGVVVLLHGIGEHSGRQARLGRALGDAGFSALAFDLRGHGRSSGRRGHVERFEDHVDDLSVFWRIVGDQGRPGPRFLLGRSLGGLVALHFLLRDRPPGVAGLILASPALRLRLKPGRARLAAGRLLDRVLPGIGLPHDIHPRQLTHDASLAREYANDPLVQRRSSARSYLELLSAMESARARAAAVETPLLVLAGGEDPVLSPEAMGDFVRAARARDKRLIVYPRFYHEVFEEVERERPIEDLIAWLRARS